ncbi:DNA cytosine methyltransferase [Gloeothece verrucosa]|uniref:DNA (cytosine-5-)-methyltransferase n=1 Tax=Gloeothece verrucosa (strain PCC 7822) TaxID=497965 RepID=E0UNF4_GLOV7|nr:DNA (cytosine-5-)-methyltransferase [Gloeothece verrucosa]ADN18484.1 DNA-cytosine methyltransferase [Gloeothece verrucosa PCC 7822]
MATRKFGQYKPIVDKDNTPTIGTLFSGGGLFDVGAMLAGIKPVWGVEFDPNSPSLSSAIAECYEKNLGRHLIKKPVQDVDFSSLVPPDFLHCSPPCQKFSLSNPQRGETDNDLELALTTRRAIETLKPQVFTLENVVPYAKSLSFQTIKETLEKLGYQYRELILDAADFGVPQCRKRFFLVATNNLIPLELTLPKKLSITWFEATVDLIDDLPESTLAAWQWQRLPFDVVQEFKNEADTAYLIERSGARNDRPLHLRTANQPAWTIKAGLGSDGKGGNRLDPINLYVKGKILRPTPRFLARIMSVPDWYELPTAMSIATTILGNGVCPLVAQQLLTALIPYLEKEKLPMSDPPVNEPNSLEIVSDEYLSADEEKELLRLERVVERSFYEAGSALRKIRALRLYRARFNSFEEYTQERFGFTRRQPYYLIEAANVVDNLKSECEPLVHILPSSERQVRPLTKLNATEQRSVWNDAVSRAQGKVPSGRIVTEALEALKQRVREKSLAPFPYNEGDVCKILVKGNPDLKGKGGHWGVIVAINNFSADIQLADGIYLAKEENLEELPYTPELREKAKIISDRLYRLSQHELEDSSKAFIAELGAEPRVILSDLEEQILNLIEKNVNLLDDAKTVAIMDSLEGKKSVLKE